MCILMRKFPIYVLLTNNIAAGYRLKLIDQKTILEMTGNIMRDGIWTGGV